MRSQPATEIRGTVRWPIFFGVPVAVLGILITFTLPHGLGGIKRLFGLTLEPYVIFFTPALIGAIGIVLYKCLPKQSIIPLGIVGWIVGISLICRYFWFGPGAFGHH